MNNEGGNQISIFNIYEYGQFGRSQNLVVVPQYKLVQFRTKAEQKLIT